MSDRQAGIKKVEEFIRSLREQRAQHGDNWQRHLELLAKKVGSNGTDLV